MIVDEHVHELRLIEANFSRMWRKFARPGDFVDRRGGVDDLRAAVRHPLHYGARFLLVGETKVSADPVEAMDSIIDRF